MFLYLLVTGGYQSPAVYQPPDTTTDITKIKFPRHDLMLIEENYKGVQIMGIR